MGLLVANVQVHTRAVRTYAHNYLYLGNKFIQTCQ